MPRAGRSGISVSAKDLPLILGMIARGDRKHDIAAWFGLNQGRIAEVEHGDHGSVPPAPEDKLPPSGSPGPKARDLRLAVEKVHSLLEAGDTGKAKARLLKAVEKFDKNE